MQIDHVQTFDYYQRSFDAVVAIGLVFLLPENDQRQLLRSVSASLRRGDQFLFTAPERQGSWKDSVARTKCLSLGKARYEAALAESGFRLAAQLEDEGQSNYYDAIRL